MNELVTKEDERYQIIADQFTDEVLDMYYQYQALKEQKETFEYQLQKLFEQYGIKSIDNDYWRTTYVPPHTTKRVDTQKMKDAGVYEEYTKESEVKGAIRVTIK